MGMKPLILRPTPQQIRTHHSLETKLSPMNSLSLHQTHQGDETESQVRFLMRALWAQKPETKWTHLA